MVLVFIILISCIYYFGIDLSKKEHEIAMAKLGLQQDALGKWVRIKDK